MTNEVTWTQDETISANNLKIKKEKCSWSDPCPVEADYDVKEVG